MNNQNFIISYGDSVTNNQLKRSTFQDLLVTLKTDSKLAELIFQVRSIEDKRERQKFKTATLPYFNFGVFKDDKRGNKNLESTQHVIIDLDDLSGEKLSEVKQKLNKDKQVCMYFLFPSGNGYKIVYQFSEPISDYLQYNENYKYYAQQVKNEYGVTTDKTSDASRPCYFSYDPELYLNENAESLEVKEFVDIVEKVDFTKVENSFSNDEEKYVPYAIEFLRNNSLCYDDWYRAGFALASLGERGRVFFEELSFDPSGKDTPKTVEKKFDNFLPVRFRLQHYLR